MARFTITIYVESFLASAGATGTQKWLGRVLTAALTDSSAAPQTEAERQLIAGLLSPWTWSDIEWDTGGTVLPPANVLTAPRPLDDYLKWAIEQERTITDHSFLRFHPNDDEAENEPVWPGLLAQLARLGPQVSRPLQLTHLEEVPAAPANDKLQIVSFRTGGRLFKPGLNLEPAAPGEAAPPEVKIECEAPDLDQLAVPGTTGLIDHRTRLVRHPDTLDERITEGWLAELPVRLGKALDPIPRLADALELGLPHGPVDGILSRILAALFATDGIAGPSPLLPLFVSIVDATPGPDAIGSDENLQNKRDYAGRWQSRFSARLDPLIARLKALFLPSPDGPQPDDAGYAARLREAYAGTAKDGVTIDTLMREALEAARPDEAGPADPYAAYAAFAAKWVASPGNPGRFFFQMLPPALARRTLMPELIRRVGGVAADWVPLQTEFPSALSRAFEQLHLPYSPEIAGRVQAAVFALDSIEVDAASRHGLPFRVDTVFADAPVGDLDVHTLLDGYLAAVSAKGIDGVWGNFNLVTSGGMTLRHHGETTESIAFSGLHTPLQIAFQIDRSGASGQTETRTAAASYHGEAMIPWSARALPQLQQAQEKADPRTEQSRIALAYAPEGDGYPALAYGQDYRVACGYQAPGGLLPMYFAADADPLTFHPATLATATLPNPADGKPILEIALRRTLIPGAPRTLSEKNEPLVLAGPNDEQVRPLWREHVARWPDAMQAARNELDGVSTLLLDGEDGATAAHRSFSFIVRPPALALAERDDGVSNAQTWRYWRERDRQFDPALPPAHATPPDTIEADDPAVVGRVGQSNTGLGGIRFMIHRVTATGLDRNIASVDVPFADGQRVRVVIEKPEAGAIAMTYSPLGITGHATLTVTIPRNTRCIFEMRTLCDARFFDGGSDARFDSAVGGEADGDVRLFGSARIAIETLPARDHLPASAMLWKHINIDAQPKEGPVRVRFGDSALDPATDFIGKMTPTVQTWNWDGGPVDSFTAAGLDADKTEPDGGGRGPAYVAFEAKMFEQRGEGGRENPVDHSSGANTLLYALDDRPNRGADYLRIRLAVESRYAPLRPGNDGNTRKAYIGADPTTGQWRGRTISARRRDRLPTPRISLAAPTFARVTQSVTTAGGIGLYLDHPMYDPRHGGGLDETLQVEVMIEQHSQRLDREIDTPDGKKPAPGETRALAAGLDPIGPANNGDPFLGKPTTPPRTLAFRTKDEPWTAKGWKPDDGASGQERVEVTTILGQTLEPSSPAPQFPFSIAFLEPLIGTGEFKPGTMARVRARTVAGDAQSDWSAPFWVQFLPDMQGVVTVGGDPVDAFTARRDPGSRDIVLEANAAAGAAGAAHLSRLIATNADQPTDAAAPYLVSKVQAVLIRTVDDVSDRPVSRVVAVVEGTNDGGNAIRFTLPDDDAASHLRVLEVQRVLPLMPDFPTAESGLEEAALRLFGSPAGLHDDGGRDGSHDIGERIVGVGPLIAIAI